MSYEVDWGLSPTGEPKRTLGSTGLFGVTDSRSGCHGGSRRGVFPPAWYRAR